MLPQVQADERAKGIERVLKRAFLVPAQSDPPFHMSVPWSDRLQQPTTRIITHLERHLRFSCTDLQNPHSLGEDATCKFNPLACAYLVPARVAHERDARVLRGREEGPKFAASAAKAVLRDNANEGGNRWEGLRVASPTQ